MISKLRFKSASGTPVYVASTSGVCAWVGPEWRELPECLHGAALAMKGGETTTKFGVNVPLGHILVEAVESDA